MSASSLSVWQSSPLLSGLTRLPFPEKLACCPLSRHHPSILPTSSSLLSVLAIFVPFLKRSFPRNVTSSHVLSSPANERPENCSACALVHMHSTGGGVTSTFLYPPSERSELARYHVLLYFPSFHRSVRPSVRTQNL